MAGQYQIANSASVVGAAIIAGGLYGCAETRYGAFMFSGLRRAMNGQQAVNGCMSDNLQFYGFPNVARLEHEARERARAGDIDPIAGLANHRMYFFSGGNDKLVKPRIVTLAAELYLRLGVPRANITAAHRDEAGHGFVTVRPGALACGRTEQPYVVSCDGYDQAQSVLGQFYDLAGGRSETTTGELIPFDQRPFVADLPTAYLTDTGRVFVPRSCREQPGCKIHVAFHGCKQNYGTVGDAFVNGAGYLNWADRNRIVVLFPDVADVPLLNPLGCWDWWGYTGFRYLTKSAPQIVAVRRMVEHLASRP